MGEGGEAGHPKHGSPSAACHTRGGRKGSRDQKHVTCTCVSLHHIFVSSISSAFIAFPLILFLFSF